MSRLLSAGATIAAAGKAERRGGESTAACFAFPDRPPTPKSVRKHRKTYFAEPGAHVVHPGLIDDVERKRAELEALSNEKRTFGAKSAGSEHVPDVFAHGPQTEMEEYVQARKEAVYRSTQREPLGRPMQRGHVLPPQTQAADFKFGVATDASEAAGRVVYPEPQAESEEARALYKRSHKSYEPGEQIRRDYATDPRAMRHGVLERDWLGEGRGAALCLNPGMDEDVPKVGVTDKRVELFRATHDRLGKPRYLGYTPPVPPEHAFGVKSAKREDWGARECIAGAYSADQQRPDPTVGRSLRAHAEVDDRSFGVPTVRRDVPKPRMISVSDHQNYGDDSNAQDLLYPSTFACRGVDDAEFLAKRSKDDLRDLFSAIGYTYPDADFERIHWRAAELAAAEGLGMGGSEDGASVEAFRRAQNEYEDALKRDTRPEWWLRAAAAVAAGQARA